MSTLKVYSVEGNPKHLLLVDGLEVLNGSYKLERKKDGLFTPHTHFKVEYECDVSATMQGRFVDYEATLTRADRIIARKRKMHGSEDHSAT